MSFSKNQSVSLPLEHCPGTIKKKEYRSLFWNEFLMSYVLTHTYDSLVKVTYDSCFNFRDASADSGEAVESEPVTEEVVDPASEEPPAEPSAPVEESVNDEPASEPLTETEVATTEEVPAETPAEDAPVEEATPVESTETAEESTSLEATEVAADEVSTEPAAEVSLP